MLHMSLFIKFCNYNLYYRGKYTFYHRMKNTYPEKRLWFTSDSRTTCQRYHCYQCSHVVQENKNTYFFKNADLSYRILVQGSVFFLQNFTHLKALQGVAFFNNTFVTFVFLKKKILGLWILFVFQRNHLRVFNCHLNIALALKGMNSSKQDYSFVFSKSFLWILMTVNGK